MKQKLMASALVLGFMIAPSSAFAEPITTIQGGTPVYTCPQGQTLQGDKCLIPERQEIEVLTVNPTVNLENGKGTYIFGGATSIDPCPFQRSLGRICEWYTDRYDPAPPYRVFDVWEPALIEVKTCPAQYTLNVDICEKSVTTVIPATFTNATVSGSNGGNLVASVTALLTPVWNFLVEKLLPAIGLLVLLGLGVRLTIKAVRKYSKVS